MTTSSRAPATHFSQRFASSTSGRRTGRPQVPRSCSRRTEGRSPRERVVLLAAWAFWNGSGDLTVADILERLDVEPAEALCFLVMASRYDADAVDDWLAEHARGEASS
jgi:hypothetical protein